ncbi:hypothetical protein ACXR0O_05435 [Verrucomicrobiota bacterium sgz303538]
MNFRSFIILSAVVVAIVGGAIWFLQSQPTPPAPLPAVATPAPVTGNTGTPGPSAPIARTETAPAPKPAVPASTPKAEPQPLAEWEVKIDQVLRSNAGETETAQVLINMLPTLPAEGQAEAAQHISNLIQDKDYNRVMPLLRNTNLPEEVHDVFVTDLMNREDVVKLPALLEIAKIPNHPHHEEAQTDLQIFLDEDFGTNWAKWDSAVKEYLRKEAAENAEDAAAVQSAPGQR